MPSWLTTFFDAITGQLATVSPLGWTVIGALAGVWLLKRFISAKRNRAPKLAAPVNRTDRALLIGALFFVAIIFSSFAVGTFEGAKAFASDQLDWKTWMVAIPWGALDASTIGFSFFAVRAINRKRSPRKPMRVAMGTAGMSAIIQMVQGGKGHHWQAGMFLAFLAIMFGIALDVVIDQLRNPLEEIVETKKLIRPSFGWRWFTSPTTLFVWLTWINYPPEGLRPTVANALLHRDNIRAEKWAKRLGRPAWLWLMPWVYAIRTAATLDDMTTALRAVRIERDDAVVEFAHEIEQIRADLSAEAARLTEQIRERTETLSAAQLRADEADRLHEQTVQNLRAEAERNLSAAVQTARAEGEQSAREQSEQTIESLRAEIRALNDDRASRVTVRRSGQMSARTNPLVVAASAGDEQVIEKLFGPFTALAAQTGQTPSRYWVEQNGPCKSRQAGRVLDALADRLRGQNGQSREQAGGQLGAQDSGQPDDPDRELAEMTGQTA